MSSWQKTVPKRGKVKRSDKSVLGQATKGHSSQEPKKLEHITTTRTAGPPGRKRKPPSRKPMVERTTKLATNVATEDVSLVANKPKGPTRNPNMAPRPVLNDKEKEIKDIERNKRKSFVQNIGEKSVMRIFLDNNGIGFKTVAVTPDCTMYELVDMMRKKLFTDTTGFGIWEVRDKLDVQLIKPTETIQDIMQYWEGDEKLYKFVFKKALGENAKHYYKSPSGVPKTNSFGASMGISPKPMLMSESTPSHQSSPYPTSDSTPTTGNSQTTNSTASPPIAKKPTPSAIRNSSGSALEESDKLTSKTMKPSNLSNSMSATQSMPAKPSKPTMPENYTSSETKVENTLKSTMLPKPNNSKPADSSISLTKAGSSPVVTPNLPKKTMPTKAESSLGISLTKGDAQPKEKANPSPVNSPVARRAPPSLPGSSGRARGAPRGGNRGAPRRGSPQRGRGGQNPAQRGVQTRGGPRGNPRQAPARNTSPMSVPRAETSTKATQTPADTKIQTLPAEENIPSQDAEPEKVSANTKHITDWSIEEVANWIEELGFAPVKHIFIENCISGKELVDLTNDELKEDLGVMALGARKGILRNIEKLNT